MKKLLLFIIFFLTFFAVKSALSSPVMAFVGTASGTLNNSVGNIDVKVTLNFSKIDGTYVGSSTNNNVPKGQTTFVTWQDPSGEDNGPYKMSWMTSCNQVGTSNVTSEGSGNYTFTLLTDVRCQTTNSTTLITTAGCDTSNNGNVSWSVNNIGYGGANISEFKVYKHQVNTDFDTDPTIVTYVTAPTTNSYSISGSAPSKLAALTATGTWYVTVKAFPANGDPGIFVTSSSFGCGANSTVVPTNLNANPTCYSSSASRVDFNWSGAQTGSFNYTVEYSLPNGPDPGLGTWPNSINATWRKVVGRITPTDHGTGAGGAGGPVCGWV